MGKPGKTGRQASIMSFFGPPAGGRAPAPAPTPPTVVRASGGGASQDSSEMSPVVAPSEGDGVGRKLFGAGGKRGLGEGSAGGDGARRGGKVRKVADEESGEDGEEPGAVVAEEDDVFVIDADKEEERNVGGGGGGDVGSFGSQFVHGRAAVAGVARARRVLDALDLSGGHAEEEGGWVDKNEWSVNVRDARQRRPGDDGYDGSTLHVPRSVLERMSPFQRQFWEMKRRYYDTMLFVKKGAFMEAYDVDADIVHRELGLNYTGGGRANMRCAGVPEGSLNKHAARLIDLGYRVGIVAQTETANTADKRKAAAAAGAGAGSSASKVCHRSLIRILTKATVTDGELLRDHRARYVIALREADARTVNAAGEVVVGVCHVDAASGRITVGEFLDDNRRSWTEKLLSTLRPPELIVPERERLSDRMRALVRWTATGATAVDVMHKGEDDGFPPMTEEWMGEYGGLGAGHGVPAGYLGEHPLASRALGAVAAYLRHLLIDRETLSLGNYTVLPAIRAEDSALCGAGGGAAGDVPSSEEGTQPLPQENAVLTAGVSGGPADGYDPARAVGGGLQMDAATMANLEILANVVDGSERDALISVVDRAATPAGRRLLRRWIADPLSLSAAINDRLNAVEDLLDVGDEALGVTRRALAAGPDLERALPRLHQFAVVSDGAVMFDDTNARRVKDFVKVLRALEMSLDALEHLADKLPAGGRARRLAWLVTAGGGYSREARKRLDHFFTACFDVRAAEKDGEVVPRAGGSPKYDAAKAALDGVEGELEAQLRHWRKELRDSSVKFYHRGKETHQLEVKAATVRQAGVPSQFIPTSESKAAKRFHTACIQRLVQRHVDASETFAEAGVNLLRDIVTRFDGDREAWSGVVKAAAEVDALIGLAVASQGDGSGPMVRPVVLPDSHPEAVFEGVDLRHPVLAAKAGASFVANDAKLGGGRETVALVTGPNCSGKSTASRSVAVAVVLAQIGAFVPATSLRMRPFDSMFARAGSRDEIARGRSTFMVEMEEAALIVNTASDRSLVIVDELCSGTTAQDAHAISHATLDRLLGLGCITMFCTHADALAVEFAGRVGNFTMAAAVDEERKTIVFLYKLVPGVTSHSRGVFCARVAGIPAAVADMAETVAKRFDDTLTAKRDTASFVKLVADGLDASQPTNTVVDLLRSCAVG